LLVKETSTVFYNLNLTLLGKPKEIS